MSQLYTTAQQTVSIADLSKVPDGTLGDKQLNIYSVHVSAEGLSVCMYIYVCHQKHGCLLSYRSAIATKW